MYNTDEKKKRYDYLQEQCDGIEKQLSQIDQAAQARITDDDIEMRTEQLQEHQDDRED